MHHVVLERWSRGQSVLHRRDPRGKTIALLVFLVVVATSHHAIPILGAADLALLIAAIILARLPVIPVLLRAGVVLPFTLVFVLITLLEGQTSLAFALLGKSYLSALAVLVVVATTPLPQFLRGLEMLLVPRFLLMVAQFLYRYLFVISEEAQHMRVASISRGGSLRNLVGQRARFRAAAGALAVLFARAYARAEEIHRAMIARGFQEHFRLLSVLRFDWADATFLSFAVSAPVVIRLVVERWI